MIYTINTKNDIFIVPKPQSMTCFEGFCKISTLTASADALNSIRHEADFFGLSIKQATENVNLFLYTDRDMADEEYEIIADEGGIRIMYSTDCGRFRALSTLKQLIAQAKDGKIPSLKIHDFPDIPVRGMMLVVNKKWYYNIDTLHYIIDHMAELKYNSFQLYFDSFVFEYDSFRRYLDDKSYYTKEDIHELDNYCKARHIELVANVETFGHMQELLALDEFKHLAVTRNDGGVPFSLNPLLEESFEVVKTMLDDLLPHYSAGTVHIGMDETYGVGENETKDYCDAFGTGRLFNDFLTKVSRHIKEKHGKRSMIWSDMAVKYPDCVGEIPKDVIFVDWGYEPGHKFGENALLCKEHGLDFYVAPGTLMWGTFTGRSDMMVQNIHFAAEAARSHGGKGFLLTEWQTVRTTTVSMLPYCFGAAFSWNSGYAKTISEADNESNCMFRNEVIQNVLAYFDRHILGCEGESCAELIYALGNCWMNEQPDSAATWNGTLVFKEFMGIDEGEYIPLKSIKLKRIINYMTEIRKDLVHCKLSEDKTGIMMKEILFACDITVYAAVALLAKRGEKVNVDGLPDRNSLIETFEYLSKAHCCVSAEHPYIKKLKA